MYQEKKIVIIDAKLSRSYQESGRATPKVDLDEAHAPT